jgi:hypothetical protein
MQIIFTNDVHTNRFCSGHHFGSTNTCSYGGTASYSHRKDSGLPILKSWQVVPAQQLALAQQAVPA